MAEVSTELIIAGFTALGSVVAFLFRLLWKRSVECEEWRNEKEPTINVLERNLGTLTAIVKMVHECKTEGCVFAGNLKETYSIQPPNTP